MAKGAQSLPNMYSRGDGAQQSRKDAGKNSFFTSSEASSPREKDRVNDGHLRARQASIKKKEQKSGGKKFGSFSDFPGGRKAAGVRVENGVDSCIMHVIMKALCLPSHLPATESHV